MSRYILPIVFLTICTAIRYDRHLLFRGTPTTFEHIEFFQNIDQYGLDVNFWKEPGRFGMPVELTIAPQNLTKFLRLADNVNISMILLQENVQNLFDDQVRFPYTRKHLNSFGWDNFYATKDIYAWMKDLAASRHSEITIKKIGLSHERRPIMAAVVVLKGSTPRSKVVIEGGIHAREWISIAFVTYLMDNVLRSQESINEDLKMVALMYEWHFIPILNPDGYEYSYTTDRMWRKNRNGVDLNRNFDFMFGLDCVFNPKSETYCGVGPFSEKETKALQAYIKSIHKGIEYYFAFHSYGQYIVIPYGYSQHHLENYDEVYLMATRAAKAISSLYNTRYTIGTAYDTVGYTLGGVSMCWIKNTYKVPYALTMELRDRGTYGFGLPRSQIKPTCEETLAGVVTLLKPQPMLYSEVQRDYKKLHVATSGYGRSIWLRYFEILFYIYSYFIIKIM